MITCWATLTTKRVGGKKKKNSHLAEDKSQNISEGRGCHKTAQRFSLPLHFLLLLSVGLSSGLFSFNSLFSLLSCRHPQMNSMNSVSSSEDIKPPPGLQNLGNINYQCTSPGGMSKHICAICGDRSSGNMGGRGGGGGGGAGHFSNS